MHHDYMDRGVSVTLQQYLQVLKSCFSRTFKKIACAKFSFFFKGTIVHIILERPFFSEYYKTMRRLCDLLELKNLKFKLKLLFVRYKSSHPQYARVNELVILFLFALYKVYMYYSFGKRAQISNQYSDAGSSTGPLNCRSVEVPDLFLIMVKMIQC